MNKLNLETFNDILFGALKDQSVEGQIKLLKAELNMIGDMLFSETAELLDELEQCGYESERFTRIKNIKSNSEGLLLKLEELEKNKNSEKSRLLKMGLFRICPTVQMQNLTWDNLELEQINALLEVVRRFEMVKSQSKNFNKSIRQVLKQGIF